MSTELSPVPSLAHFHAELRGASYPKVPELHCPFEPAIHPDVTAIQAASVAWAEAHGLAPNDRAKKRLGLSKIASLVSRAHPDAPRDRVQIAADWTTLFCLLDDHIEKLPSMSAVDDYLAQVLAVARGTTVWTEDPFRRAMADVRRRLAAIASPAAMARIEDAWAELFDAFCKEAGFRARGEIPSLAAYVPMRQITVGIPVELAIGEVVDGIDLGAAPRNRGPLRTLARMACNLVGWSNDIYTFEKELAEGEPCNLVAVVGQAARIGIRDAVARAAAMHDGEARTFAAMLDDVDSQGDAAFQYARLLRCWVRGHLDWAHETGRYAP